VSDPAAALVLAHTHVATVPFVPEIRLYQADEPIGLWDLLEGEYCSDQPAPFWAFAWPGGQGLARYLLDNPDTVAGRRVLDLAAGSGIVAIAAAKAGTAQVRAVDVDPVAMAAIGLNARANNVAVAGTLGDILAGDAGDADVVLAGDVFYSKALAGRMLKFLRRAARGGARVLVGDPNRALLPRPLFRALATFEVPVPPVLEGTRLKRTTIWELHEPHRSECSRGGSTAAGSAAC
jgi:predicted nicotinamide N-methyase